jgi:hypothetical protein
MTGNNGGDSAHRMPPLDTPDEEWTAEIARRDAELAAGAPLPRYDGDGPDPPRWRTPLRREPPRVRTGSVLKEVGGRTALLRLAKSSRDRLPEIAPHLLWRAVTDDLAGITVRIGDDVRFARDWAGHRLDAPRAAVVAPDGTVHQMIDMMISDLALREWIARHVWPPPVADDGSVVPTPSGAPGRPTSMQLVEGELSRRKDRNELKPGVGQEAIALLQWLGETHPDAVRLTVKTIKNRLSSKHRHLFPAGTPDIIVNR